MNKTKLGRLGEDTACRMLEEQGYRICNRNYRCVEGEIDIIACKDDTLCFVEVKTRSSYDYGRPAEAVDVRKRRRIRGAALHYMKNGNMDTEKMGKYHCKMDFQVIEIILRQTRNAF